MFYFSRESLLSSGSDRKYSQSGCCSFFVQLTKEIVQPPPSLRCPDVFGPVGQFHVKLKTGGWMREQFSPFAGKVVGLWAQQPCVVCFPADKHAVVFSTVIMARRTINTIVGWCSEVVEFLRMVEWFRLFFFLLVGVSIWDQRSAWAEWQKPFCTLELFREWQSITPLYLLNDFNAEVTSCFGEVRSLATRNSISVKSAFCMQSKKPTPWCLPVSLFVALRSS